MLGPLIVVAPLTQAQTQDPIAAAELHVSYDARPRLWALLDGNFWYGGRTSVSGVESPQTLRKSSHVAATVSIPVTRRGSVKVSYARCLRPVRRRLPDLLRRVAVHLDR